MIHLGAAIGTAGVQLLAGAVESTAGPLHIDEDALLPIEAEPADGIRWLADAADLIQRTRRAPGMRLCITYPELAGPKQRAPDKATAATRAALEATIVGAPDASAQAGSRWGIVPVHGGCPVDQAPAPTIPSRP